MARARGAESLAALLDRLRGEGRVAARKKLVATWGRGALPALVRVVANEKETPGMRVQAAYTGALIGQKAAVPAELLEAGLLLKGKDEMLGRWSAQRLIDQAEE